ncbi:MAG: MATE family efflux transporter [Bacteroidaceae bacterium]|nr:MATE family efflux transporter [Bacteroidaceae bacterium]
MSVPTIISMLTSSLYSLADTFFVGQIDTQATAAVGIVFAVLSVFQAFAFFFGHGSGNYMSRMLGAKQRDEAVRMASTGFFTALLFGVVMAVTGLLLLTPLSRWLGSTETILPYTERYLGIILVGTPLNMGAMVLNNQMRFQGNARYAMVGIVTGTLLNVALDPLLIFVFDLGISGAALATVLGHLCSFLLLLYLSRKGENIRIHFRNFTPTLHMQKEIIAGGSPSLMRQGLGSIATLLLNIVAAGYGDAAVAAMSIVGRITFVVYSIIIGLGQGYQPLCGFSYGAGLYDRVKQGFWFCIKVGTAFLIVCTIVGFLFTEQIISVFRDDIDVVSIGSEALRYQLYTYPIGAFILLSNMMMQTINRPWQANLMASARRGLFFIPLIILLPFFFGLKGVEMCQAVSDVFTLLLAMPLVASVFRRM